MKIIHVGNTAGVASTLAKYQRRVGHDVSVVVRKQHPFAGFEENPQAHLYRPLLSFAQADVLHYHYQPWITSIMAGRIRAPDLLLMRALRKKIVFHYHGDDARGREIKSSVPSIVATPDLLEWVPDATWVPNPVDCEFFTPDKPAVGPKFRVGYYGDPASGEHVPAREIESAVAELRAKYPVEAVPAMGLRHDEMPAYYRSLTLYVDKVKIGAYSLMACEAAASGLPVIASTSKIKPYLNHGGVGFFEFSGNIAEDLRYLIENDETLREIARKGRDYVLATHEASKVVEQVLEVYKSLAR